MTDLEFERLVRSALLDANQRDFADSPEGPSEFVFSPAYRKWEARFLADPFGYVRKHARPPWRRAVRVGLCAVLVALLTFGAVLAVSPAARQWVVQWFETHAVFTFEGESGEYRTPGNWYPEYLPEGFELVREDINDIRVTLVFTGLNDENISLTYFPKENANFLLDNEHQVYSGLTFSNGTPAFASEATSIEQRNQLIWADPLDETAFKLIGPCDLSELIAIAESIRQK